jgi:dienelactone hydrolase
MSLNFPFLSADQDAVLRWMDQIAQQELQARQKTITEIHTVAEAEQRQKWVREKLFELMGGLPNYKGPLNPKITGQIAADGYTIEKVIFESLPGLFVTANLYRPNQPGRYPAVLFQSGHTQEGKAEPQRAAANLALKGFVVLCFDPIGQGERVQSFDRQLGRSVSFQGGSGNDHIQAGAQSMLIGEGVGRYFIWDSERALDYLLSRPEVDPLRVGAVGCSSGGSSTTFISALDNRIKVVAPACFTNSYRLLFAGPDPDPEMEFPNFLSSGLDHADFAELAAPKPWLILATEGDYYSPPAAKLVYEEARRWYHLFGAEDNVRFFVGSGPHGTPLETREAIYEWMIRWLKNGRGDFLEQHVKLYTNYQLQVTRSGQVEDELGSRKIFQVILEEFRAKKRQGTIPELLAELRRLKIPSDGSIPATKVLEESNSPDGRR